MTDREKAKQRSQLLKRLRAEHEATVGRTQARLKEQNKIQREIKRATKGSPKTVPAIADELGYATHVVLWHLSALRKYGGIYEDSMDGEYFTYSSAKEKN